MAVLRGGFLHGNNWNKELMDKLAKEMMAEIKDIANDAKKDIEDAEFTEVKAEDTKKAEEVKVAEEPKVTLKSDPILV
jgi:hypothetical protein